MMSIALSNPDEAFERYCTADGAGETGPKYIPLELLGLALEDVVPGAHTDAQLQHAINELHCTAVDAAAFARLCAHLDAQTATDEDISCAFDLLDEDGSGFIETDEFIGGMMCGDAGLTRDEACRVMTEFDIDGDGRISRDEFVAMVTARRRASELLGLLDAAATDEAAARAALEDEEWPERDNVVDQCERNRPVAAAAATTSGTTAAGAAGQDTAAEPKEDAAAKDDKKDDNTHDKKDAEKDDKAADSQKKEEGGCCVVS
jgi:Ca2+-binding EF-hand superfamily protein